MSRERPAEEASARSESLESLDSLRAAADLFEARQEGTNEPEGTWVDRVWLPSDAERRSCCAGLEPDRVKDPQKLRSHCRTLLHVAHLFDLDSRALRAELRRRRQAREAAWPAAETRWPVGKDAEPAGPGELAARVTRLIDDKRGELGRLALRTSEASQELNRQLHEGRAVEVALVETQLAEVAEELRALAEEIDLLITLRERCRQPE